MLIHEQTIALQLLRDHPGWSDERVSLELGRAGDRTSASPSSVRAWRLDAGLAPMTNDVEAWPPPRRVGVMLRCGHLAHPGDAGCRRCGS